MISNQGPKGVPLVLIALLICSSAPAVAQQSIGSPQTLDSVAVKSGLSENRTLDSASGLVYDVSLINNERVNIRVENTQDKEVRTGLFVDINKRELHSSVHNLSSGEQRNWTFNITPHLDITRDNHTVTVSTFGDYTQYNFTREIDASSTEAIPKPHITNVEVTNGTIDGEQSAVAKVSVSNPSIQAYGTKLMVFTEGTDGSFYDATLPPGENRTITVELLDQRGAKVAGEARLYTENLSRPEGAMDQVEFVGRAGENTTVWNESYEPVKAPWRAEHYQYQNESIQTGADKTGVVPGMSWTQEFYAGLGVIFLALVGLKRKLT